MEHENPNTKYNADIVISKTLPFGKCELWKVWKNDDLLAQIYAEGLHLLKAGAASYHLSVYDADNEQFVVGSIDQLDPA